VVAVALAAVVAIAALAWSVLGDEGGPVTARHALEGFEEVAFRLERTGGSSAEWCALLADDGPSRARGLMGRRDLAGYDGMMFRFEGPTTTSFHMRSTLIPLSIAFFDAEGDFVSAADMVPCSDEATRCPSYGAPHPYLHALEVPRGALEDLGATAGSSLSFPGGSCAP
jgi:uncharacterized membrane protein (UPF0127 family)